MTSNHTIPRLANCLPFIPSTINRKSTRTVRALNLRQRRQPVKAKGTTGLAVSGLLMAGTKCGDDHPQITQGDNEDV
jgi:hypothetical protein